MLNQVDDIILLLRKHLQGTLTPEETTALNGITHNSEAIHQLFLEINNREATLRQFSDYYQYAEKITEEELHRLVQQHVARKQVVTMRKTRMPVLRWFAAAVVAGLTATGLYLAWFAPRNEKQHSTVAQQPDVPPGAYKATLMLSDGRRVALDKFSSAEIGIQGNARIVNQNGALVYTAEMTEKMARPVYNTLSTARGETYPAVLADGSKVWLNAASSIRYPVPFSGKERSVELIAGEAYFEAAHDPAQPFVVTAGNVQVHVLGTKFNINAYADESYTGTTLLEGKVKVRYAAAKELSISPGQQLHCYKNGGVQQVREVDAAASVSWVNGIFHFEEADLHAVLRQLARWYNVDIEYRRSLPAERIQGDMERNIPLSKILANLEKIADVDFTIEGRKIVVM